MEGDSAWSDDEFESDQSKTGPGTGVFLTYLENMDNEEKEKERDLTSIDILPDDVQEQILSSLPVAWVFKACCVSKKWNNIVHSKKFILNSKNVSPNKPWYFMFTTSDDLSTFIYDPVLRQWYNYNIPLTVEHNWIVSPSRGLVCLMDEESSTDLYICNPITRIFKKLQEPSVDVQSFVYSTVAFSVDGSTDDYSVAVVRTRHASDNYLHWDISINIYDSITLTWSTEAKSTLTGWRAGTVSAIVNGVLYFLVFSTRTGATQNLQGLLVYNLGKFSSNFSLGDMIIPIPCSLTCGRLMNIQSKLVMVGGIGRRDRPGVIKGIGIWVLENSFWEEISKVPHKYFQGFGELDDVFASTGSGDLIYIQSYGGVVVLVFDMKLRQWSWSHKCPALKKFPLQLFSGFCFEPRLEISP